MKKLPFILFLVIFTGSCTDYTPKPIGYNRIDVPENNYREYENSFFSFLYSGYAFIDSVKSDNRSDFWFDITYPRFNVRIHCSYISITPSLFRDVLNDSHNFAYSHVLKADGIEQTVYRNEDNNTSGIIYEIDGNVASPIQFFLTDSISNFFRASFYFNTSIKQDSVAPVTGFIREDIRVLIDSFKWENKN